jgi:hypothetical protein
MPSSSRSECQLSKKSAIIDEENYSSGLRGFSIIIFLMLWKFQDIIKQGNVIDYEIEY